MIKPVVFGVSGVNLFWVSCDAEFITARGLLWKRRVPLERVIAITAASTIIWVDRRGRRRRKGVWFFGTGRFGDDLSHGRRRALRDWFSGALESRLSSGKRKVPHMDNPTLHRELQVALRGEEWSRGRDERLHRLWVRRVETLQRELDRRADARR